MLCLYSPQNSTTFNNVSSEGKNGSLVASNMSGFWCHNAFCHVRHMPIIL